MRRRLGIWVVVTAMLGPSGGVGCSSGAGSESPENASGAPNTGGNGPTPNIPLPDQTSCDVPAPPAPLGVPRVVGAGTAASCTRAALQEVASAGGDITFDCGSEPVTIAIDQTVRVEQDAILDGAGLVTLDGDGQSRILLAAQEVHLAVAGLGFINGVAEATDGTVESGGAIAGGWRGSLDIRDCVFTDNVAGTSGEEGGGAVYTPSRTTMTIVGCRFERNRGGTGGAVHNLLSGLTIVDSVFTDNESLTDGGGAVYTDGASEESDDAVGGTIRLCGCRFVGNVGRRQGGGAYLFAYPPDNVVVGRCEFTDNEVVSIDGSGALGGGLRVGNAPLDLFGSLFQTNHSDRHGGGLWVDGEWLSRVENCTFVANDVGVPGAEEPGYGGAISGGNLAIRNLTIAGNTATANGGGIFNEDQTSTLTNSILIDNTAGNEWGIKQACRDPLQGSHNIQWPDPGDDVRCTSDIVIADPELQELADNGGPTATLAPSATSPALDQADDCPDSDQRGEPRESPCDVGAHEVL